MVASNRRVLLILLIGMSALGACENKAPAGLHFADLPVVHTSPVAWPRNDAADPTLGRVAGIVRLGAFDLVADGLSQENLRIDRSTGEVTRLSGPGDGPGEHRGVMWMRPFGHDAVLTWDFSLARGLVIGPDGNTLETRAIKTDPRFPLFFAEGVFGDGSLFAQAGPPGDGVYGGERWSVIHLVRVLPDSVQDLGAFPRMPCDPGVAGRCADPGGPGIPQGLWAAGSDFVAVARTDSDTLLIVYPDGRDARDWRVGEARALFVDSEDRVWIEGREEWKVLDPSNGPLARVALGDVRPLWATGGTILGVQRDELDQQWVREFRMVLEAN